MQNYRILTKLGEGSYGKIFKCQKCSDQSMWACKELIHSYQKIDAVYNIAEVKALRQVRQHPNIIELHEIIFNSKVGIVYLMFELMDMDLYMYIKDRASPLPKTIVCKCVYSVLVALEYIHSQGLIHRDVKPENILIRGECIKLADFGMCRSMSSTRPLTDYVATRWYRAPECILTRGHYGKPIDVWSVGCVMFEIMTFVPLFAGKSDIDQINKIHQVFGTPSRQTLNKLEPYKHPKITFHFPAQQATGFLHRLVDSSVDTADLLVQMLMYGSDYRIDVGSALKHPYFDHLRSMDVNGESESNTRIVPIIEVHEDIVTSKSVFATQKDSARVNSPNGFEAVPTEQLWETLCMKSAVCCELARKFIQIVQHADLDDSEASIISKSARIIIWESFLLLKTTMNQIQMNFDHILDQIKIGLNILVKGPTWTIQASLLRTILEHISKRGEDCLLLIDRTHHRYEEVRNQIHGIAKNETEHSLSIGLPFGNPLQLSVQNIINTVVHLMMIVAFNKTTVSLGCAKKGLQARIQNLRHLDQILQNVIASISTIKLHFQLWHNTQLDILNEHIRTMNALSLNASEEVFVMSLMREQLRHLYEKACTFLNQSCLYLAVTEKLFIKVFGTSLVINMPFSEDQLSNISNVVQWSTDMSTIPSQWEQLIEEQKPKYTKIIRQQQLALQQCGTRGKRTTEKH